MSNLTDLPDNKTLACTLVITPDITNRLAQDGSALEVAQAYVIDGPEMATLANEELRSIKARIETLETMREGFVAPAKQILANAEALFAPAIKANRDAEAHLKQALVTFQVEERRKADEARRHREEAERKARQEAAEKAAKARAEAEAKAREEQRRAAEAEETRRKAEAEGNPRAAAAAAKLAAEATAKATAAIENGEAKAQEVELAAAATPVAAEPVRPATKLEGFSMREKWAAKLAPGMAADVDAIKLIASKIEERPDLLAYISLEWKAVNRAAAAMKEHLNIPGIVAHKETIAASRK